MVSNFVIVGKRFNGISVTGKIHIDLVIYNNRRELRAVSVSVYFSTKYYISRHSIQLGCSHYA